MDREFTGGSSGKEDGSMAVRQQGRSLMQMV